MQELLCTWESRNWCSALYCRSLLWLFKPLHLGAVDAVNDLCRQRNWNSKLPVIHWFQSADPSTHTQLSQFTLQNSSLLLVCFLYLFCFRQICLFIGRKANKSWILLSNFSITRVHRNHWILSCNSINTYPRVSFIWLSAASEQQTCIWLHH